MRVRSASRSLLCRLAFGLVALGLALALSACVEASDFKYTERTLVAMPEQQLTPPGAVALGQYGHDGGYGIAMRGLALSTRYLGSNSSQADISGYYDREL